MKLLVILVVVLSSCSSRYHDATVEVPVILTTAAAYTVIIEDQYISVCTLGPSDIAEGDSIAIEIRRWPDGSFDILRVLGPIQVEE